MSTSFLVPEMAHDVIESHELFWVARILDIVCSMMTLIMLMWYIYHLGIVKQSQPTSKTQSAAQSHHNESENCAEECTLHILTCLFILFNLFTIIILTLNIWSIFPLSMDCDIIVYTLCTCFHLSKCFFYTVLIKKSQLTYKKVIAIYTPCQFYTLYIFIGIYSFIILFGTFFVVYGKWLTSPHFWCHVHINDVKYESFGILSWIIMDGIISIVLLYVFQKPLQSLTDDSMQLNEKMIRWMVKDAFLTWCTILMSMISLLLYLWKHITILIEFNIPFVVCCVIMIHSKKNKLFEKVLEPCINAIIWCKYSKRLKFKKTINMMKPEGSAKQQKGDQNKSDGSQTVNNSSLPADNPTIITVCTGSGQTAIII